LLIDQNLSGEQDNPYYVDLLLRKGVVLLRYLESQVGARDLFMLALMSKEETYTSAGVPIAEDC
jgi:hypothetical protein